MTDRSQHAGAGSGRGRSGPPGGPPGFPPPQFPPEHPPGYPPPAESCSPAQRVALGSYALGALEPEEADQVRTHLMECAACRTEYRELAGVPALLARISEAEMSAEPAVPGAGMLAGLLAKAAAREAAGMGALDAPSDAASQGTANVPAQAQGPAAAGAMSGQGSGQGSGPGHALSPSPGHAAGHGAHDAGQGQRARGRRRAAVRQKSRLIANLWSGSPKRRFAVSAGGAVLLTAAAVAVYVAASGADSSAVGRTVQATNSAMGITGTVQYHPTEWGSWVEVTMHNVPPGDDCMLLAVDDKGNRVVASTWWAPSSGVATIPGAVAMEADEITRFEVVTATGSTLLDVPAH